MFNIFDSLKQLFIFATTAIAVLNPFNVYSPKTTNISPTPIPTEIIFQLTPTPTITKATIPCGPGQNSGQYVYIKNANDCQNYTDCGLNDGSWKLMTKEECSIAQKQDISPRQSNNAANIDCIGPDGKHSQKTQKECDDFNAAWGKPQQNNRPQEPDWRTLVPLYGPAQNASSSEPTITCVLSHGTYQLTQSSCDLFKSSVNPPEQTVTCILSYGVFQISQSSCDSYKIMDNLPKPTPFQLGPMNTTIIVPTPMQIVEPTPRTCTSGMVNSYGAVGAISVPCK